MVASATFYFFYRVREIIVPFIIGCALAYVLYPLVKLLENRGVGRTWAILMTYLAILLLLSIGLWYIVPHLAAELSVLGQQVPEYMNDMQNVIDRARGAKIPTSLEVIVEASVSHTETVAYRALQGFLDSIIGALGSLLSIVFVPIIAFYLTVDWDKIREGFLALFPSESGTELGRLGRDIDQVLTGFIKGELLISLVVGLITGGAAFLLGSKYGIVIGIIMAVAELFPYFGPFLGAIPAVALALTQGPRSALYMALAIFVIQQLESNLLSPKIVGNRVGLHPLLVVFALFSGGELFGIWGMLFAVPTAAMLKIAAKYAFYLVVD
ncbi:MAG: AI-2E family transporter [Ignavibacteriales bacterium]